jgi:YVTN family beta-propeller protein
MNKVAVVRFLGLGVLACTPVVPSVSGRPARAADLLPIIAIHDAPKGEKNGAISFVDPDSYAILATVPVEGDPWPGTFGPSGDSYFVLGGTARSAWTGKAAGPWSVVAVDRAAGKSSVLGEVGLPPVWTSVPEGRSRMYTLGRGDKNAPDVLSVFDLAAKKSLGRFPTAPGAVDWQWAAGGTRLWVLHGGDVAGKKDPPSRLIGFDTEASRPVADVPLPPRAVTVLAGDEGRALYVLCRGGKPKEGAAAQGKVVVLDAASGEVRARLDVGFEGRFLRVDERNGFVYALGDDPAGGAMTLTVLRGIEVKGRVKLPTSWGALHLGPDPGRAYLAGDKAVVEVDPAALAVTRAWTLDFDPSTLVFDSERSRVFATPNLGLKVAELGLDDGKVHMNVTTGRTGTKVGKAIGLALVGVSERSGTAFAMGEDGRHLYVVNGQTDDLTVIDTTGHTVVDAFATGGGTRAILAPPGTGSVYVVSKDHLSRIDTKSNARVQEIPYAEGGALTLDAARHRLYVGRGTALDLIDAATGERLASIDFPFPVSTVVMGDIPR